MTVTNDIPKGPCKLAIYTSVSQAFDDASDTAYLEINAEQAKALLELIRLTMAFRKETSRLMLASEFFSVSVGVGDALPQFRVIRIPFSEEALTPDSNEPVMELPRDFDPDLVSEEDEFRVECHRVEVDQHGVRFTALAKHGDSEFTTEDIRVTWLQAIAQGRDLDLPKVELAPEED